MHAQITVIRIVSFTLIVHWTKEKMITSLFVWKRVLTPLTQYPPPLSLSKKKINDWSREKLFLLNSHEIKSELSSHNLQYNQLGNCQRISWSSFVHEQIAIFKALSED